VSSLISLRRENDASRFEFRQLGLALGRRFERSNGNGNSQRARFDLGLRSPGEKAFLERGLLKFWGSATRSAPAMPNRRPSRRNELFLGQ